MNALTYTRDNPGARKLFNPKEKTISRESLPCFKHFGEAHTEPCEYQHSVRAMEEYREMLWGKLTKSRYAGLDWIAQRLKQHKEGVLATFKASPNQLENQRPPLHRITSVNDSENDEDLIDQHILEDFLFEAASTAVAEPK